MIKKLKINVSACDKCGAVGKCKSFSPVVDDRVGDDGVLYTDTVNFDLCADCMADVLDVAFVNSAKTLFDLLHEISQVDPTENVQKFIDSVNDMLSIDK